VFIVSRENSKTANRKENLAARRASEEPVHLRFKHRLPWLLLGLGGALFAADIVGWFEHRLQEKLLLAFFIT